MTKNIHDKADNEQGAREQVVAYTEKSQVKHENRHIQLVREYGFHPRTKASVSDGAVLPRKYEPFPGDMYGRPLEEIDTFIYEETFCVVSKRFKKNYIHRFTGTKSLFLFEPWSKTRRICVYIATNQYFDYVVMATILLNCIFLAMTETVEEAEYIFLAIYSCEMVIKVIAKGFVLNKYTYLRNPWNWLDFVVITSGYATIGMEVGNLAGLRTFRVLRALKTVSIMPGLKTIINALLHSFKQLAEVMTLTIFCLMVFALFALQVYMGELRNKCVKNVPDGWNVTHEEWRMWINDTDNWIYDEEDIDRPMLCGNLTGARHCPTGYTCLCVGNNPNHGYTNFDNFMWSMLTTFQLITLDYWENVYNMILATSGPMSVTFFTVVVFFGSFYLINLMLAVVALAYEEEAEITLEERKKDLLDHRDDSTFSFDPSTLTVRKLNKNHKKKIDSRKGVLLASYSRKKTRKRKKGGKENDNNGNKQIQTPQQPQQQSYEQQQQQQTQQQQSQEQEQQQHQQQPNTSRSITPSPNSNTKQIIARPQVLAVQRTRGLPSSSTATAAAAAAAQVASNQNPNVLHPLGVNYRGQLLPTSRQASSNTSEGGGNRESSLDDSGVVDDHEEQDIESANLQTTDLQRDVTPLTTALSPRDIQIIKCNGNITKIRKDNVCTYQPEYLSHIVMLDDLPDRNCGRCEQCCIDYDGWLQFQNCLYKIVKDPLFELGITLCIVLNTLFLALEHHGMSEMNRRILDIGNKVFTSIFAFECIVKLMALSKDFFGCGWNIFDLIVVSASICDIFLELLEGLSVLRGLRLLRVLKLAQSWTTMKVLLSIIISTIGALGNLTLILVIVIYIFAVIGMQLFSKDYTPEKFFPDPVPRWNFNDFFHSFMMIFRILCGEWIEPLWDCMRAEEKDGASTCFLIFLPTLVMGNFMVLNLFLALLLNSFNSEELKNRKEEVGDESRLARSFERIRSIIRKQRLGRSQSSKMSEVVSEVIKREKKQKLRKQYPKTLYRRSYEESLKRPISGSDFGYEIPLKDPRCLEAIMSKEELTAEQTTDIDADTPDVDKTKLKDTYVSIENERKLLQQMSSGCGTQQNDSKDEPTYAESLELQVFSYPTQPNDGDPESFVLLPSSLKPDNLDADSLAKYSNERKASTPTICGSMENVSQIPKTLKLKENSNGVNKCRSYASPTSQCSKSDRKLSVSGSITHNEFNIPRLMSDQSINSISNDHEVEVFSQQNLRDELLSCDKKELFQFLNDDFDNSHNYFSDTVGYGSALIDPDTDSLMFDSKRDTTLFSPVRKASTASNKSNLSYISNSIFEALEQTRGGSISESIDRKSLRQIKAASETYQHCDELEPLVQDSEFENIIASFEKELSSIKNSTCSLQRQLSAISRTPDTQAKGSFEKSSSTNTYEEILPMRQNNNSNQSTRDSVKLKRRSLEKQMKIDDDFNVPHEIKKICDNMQAPFADSHMISKGIKVDLKQSNSYSGGSTDIIISPKPRRRSEFHNSLDRIKRSSLIDRVDESLLEGDLNAVQHQEQQHLLYHTRSERLPRKYLNPDMNIESLSLKSTGSYEHLVCHTENKETKKIRFQKSSEDNESSLTDKEKCDKNTSDAIDGDEHKDKQNAVALSDSDKPWHCLVSYVDDLTGGRRNSKGLYDDPMLFPSFGKRKAPKVPDDCFPQKCYERCPCWRTCCGAVCQERWCQMRTAVLSVVDTPAFEWFVLVLIFASSITLCFEDIYLDSNVMLKRLLYWTNFIFSMIFVVEMVLKWMALGFTRYFTSFWTILDFIIVFVSVFSLLIEENENLKVLRSLRTLRALRPLRAISRWQGMRIVVNALMYAIPSIFNVLLVCLVFWLIFSIMGVQFFGGKFFKCVDDEGVLLDVSIVKTRTECLHKNYTWINSRITFDHVGMGYLALLQVATFEGWMEVMADAVDCTGVDLQPQREANLYAYIYFVIFIVCGSFFTLNLFIGVIIDNFNMLKKKYEGGVLEMFLTESQKHYYTAMKKLGRKKPQKVIKRPLNTFLAMFYDLSNSRRFEIAIFVLIFLNMLTMGIEHYDQPHAIFFILEVSNAFFTTVFGLEAIVKIVGLRYHYFTVPWNVFDFLLVLASIFGILMEDVMIDLPISPTLLRVVRVFRIGRILRLIKAAKGIRKLLFALVVSLPALFNIGALLALITFIYAICGMSLFGHVRLQGALNDMVNFQTFGRSMTLLFRLMTSAGWNDVLESLMIQPPKCNPHFNNQTNGDCGHPLLAITYFTSFIIINYMIVINMYIAIILENFNQAHQEEEIGIVEDDLEMFYIRWSKYDPHATQFIHFSQVSDFLASLDPPLGIPKPNTVALVSFNLPISSGNKIHCLDILHALVKHVLGHVEETDNFKQLQEQMDVKFKKQFPTRKELEIVSSTRIWKREDKAARTLQYAWREYLRLKKERERSPLSQEDEHTQTSSPGGWHSKLSALNFLHLQVHRRGTATSSRASSRKSSRASDASDLSELAGPWLNLPLMLVGGAGDMLKDMKPPEDDKNSDSGSRTPRRKSFYNFFLRHQDAVDDSITSPSVNRKAVSPNASIGRPVSAADSFDEKQTQQQQQPQQQQQQQQQQLQTSAPIKTKRATSFVRKKPPFERGLSAQSALRINKNAHVVDGPSTTSSNTIKDVSILVTEPSPDIPPASSISSLHVEPPSTLVHVLVHRESEEYQTDLEDSSSPDKDEQMKKPQKSPTQTQLLASPGRAADDLDSVSNNESIVKIMVESPKEPPNVEFGVAFPQTAVVRYKTETTHEIEQTDGENSPTSVVTLVTDNIQEPIDVNIPRDTTNIFYAYEETEIDNSFQAQPAQLADSFSASIPETHDTIDTSNLLHNNQSVNDDTQAPTEMNTSDNQTANQISSDNSRSSS
ncbi:sodium channel protein 60E isoform X2 [Contarinia nasturtii]|uniref:sodium channel protein 60E isoform X2 n=1 Tax=Contarinia nasturtii TaxID=265458 RepID=UPI0012D44E21|nr:sodium channel protein 60E isoform X2 [Contarinia nasturtii]